MDTKKSTVKMNGDNQNITSSHNFPKCLPGLDIESFLTRLGGDGEFCKSILKDFSNYYHCYVSDITDSLDRRDFKTAKELAHTLKGVAGNISAYELSKTAAEIETAIVEERTYDFSGLLDKLNNALTQVLNSIELIGQDGKVFENNTSLTDLSSDKRMQYVSEIMSELAGYLRKNSNLSEEVFTRLKKCFSNPDVDEDLNRIGKAVDKFDFKTALSYLYSVADSQGISIK